MGKLFRSRAYKVIVGYIYGWGAAAVIIGALFKIMHYPGASYILSIGMIIEAAIFAISAFEPLVEHYDWARVFPELGNDKESLERSGIASTIGLRNQPVSKVNIIEELAESEIEQLKESIHKMIASANNFTAATASVPEFGEKVGNITVTLEQLDEKTRQVEKMLEKSVQGFSEGCEEINKILLQSSRGLSEQIKTNCEKFISNLGSSAEGFKNLNVLMDEHAAKFKGNSENFTNQISSANKHISALNTLYELQVNETKECLESFRGMQKDMGEMLEHVSLGLDNTKLFKKESQQLANNVASLSSVYGSMLSVVNNN